MKLCLFLGIRTRGKGMNKYEEKKDIFPKFERIRRCWLLERSLVTTGHHGQWRRKEEISVE